MHSREIVVEEYGPGLLALWSSSGIYRVQATPGGWVVRHAGGEGDCDSSMAGMVVMTVQLA